MRLDMHMHTPTSDGSGRPKDYVRAILDAGLDGVVLTDHHVTRSLGLGDKSAQRQQPAADKIQKAILDAGLICFRGCEYSSNDGHVLLYGVDVETLDLGMYMPLQEVVWRVRDAGGVAVPSHPYAGVARTLGDKIDQIGGLVALERYNGQNQVRKRRADKLAKKAAKRLGLATIGNSDAHQAHRIGLCWTEFAHDVSSLDALVEVLLSGEGYRARRDTHRIRKILDSQAKRSTWQFDWAYSESDVFSPPQTTYQFADADIESCEPSQPSFSWYDVE